MKGRKTFLKFCFGLFALAVAGCYVAILPNAFTLVDTIMLGVNMLIIISVTTVLWLTDLGRIGWQQCFDNGRKIFFYALGTMLISVAICYFMVDVVHASNGEYRQVSTTDPMVELSH